jgi:HEAT repeat protein
MIKASDEKLSLAAIEVLKRVGNAEAMSVLAKKKDLFKGKLHVAVMDGYLYCVDGLLAAGETKKAAKAYKRAYRIFESDPIRIAAVRGMLNTAGKKKVRVILNVLKSDDSVAQAVVISAVRDLDPAAIKPILRKFKSLSETGKVQLVTAISEMNTEAVLKTVTKAASSDSEALRLAAVKALAIVGDADSAKLLAKNAANSKGNEQRTCRTSLYSLAAAGTDEAIIASYNAADAGVKIELLKAVAERKIDKSKSVVLKGTKDSDAKVRVEALRTVTVTQNLTLDELLDTLAIASSDGERSLAEKTVVVVVKARKNTSADTKQIVKQMDDLKKKGVDVSTAALRVLGGIGNNLGYDTLVSAISSKNEKIQRAAIDGLTQWPDGKPAEVLMATVSNGLNKSNQVMAFRGLIAQLGKVKGNKSAHLYAEAMKIAPGVGEKRQVLSALTLKPCAQTLDLALAYIEDPKLKKEAVTAVSQILANFNDPLDEKTLLALRKAKTQPGSEAISKRFLELTAGDLSAWAKPLGKWEVVGKVSKSTENEKKLIAETGNGIIYNGPDGKTNNLLSAEEHGNVTAHIEFMVPKGSNSGIYFMGRYEIQVLDSYGVEDKKLRHAHCGGIYQRWKDGKGFEGRAPKVNASKPAGQWQSFDIVFKAPRFNRRGRKQANARFVKVVHNGIVIHENQEVTGMTRSGMSEKEKSTGPLMLQGDHGPVAYRNIYLIKNSN